MLFVAEGLKEEPKIIRLESLNCWRNSSGTGTNKVTGGEVQ